jgi:DNA-binding Lrp family transcriptional regulator
VVDLARRLGVSRATVQARLDRLERTGVVVGHGPDVDVAAAGFGVQAFVTLQIRQGALTGVGADLDRIPEVIQAWSTTGEGDVLCLVATPSHDRLQSVLLAVSGSSHVVRTTSVVVLSTVIERRVVPLLRTQVPSRRRGSPTLDG